MALKTFYGYLENQKIDQRIDVAAQLIAETGFPIQSLCDWYCDVGIYLSNDRRQQILESWWADTAKSAAGGATVGAGVGAVTGAGWGAIPGAAIGGALGAGWGAAKHVGQGISKLWRNPNVDDIDSLQKYRDEAVKTLEQMQKKAAEIRNNSQLMTDDGKGVHHARFDQFIGDIISRLRGMRLPRIVGSTPSSNPSPQRPPATSTPSPSRPPITPSTEAPKPTSQPRNEKEMAENPEFQKMFENLSKFAKTIGPGGIEILEKKKMKIAAAALETLQDADHSDDMAGNLLHFQNRIVFGSGDEGYRMLLNLFDEHIPGGISERAAKLYYFTARIEHPGYDDEHLADKAFIIGQYRNTK